MTDDADSELNEAVARKLGWKPSYPHENGCQFCEETRGHHHEWGSFGQRSILEHIPDYCHSIAAAWEIVETLRDDGYTVVLEWATMGGNFKWIFRAHGQRDRSTQRADTAPMAICRAFLKLP